MHLTSAPNRRTVLLSPVPACSVRSGGQAVPDPPRQQIAAGAGGARSQVVDVTGPRAVLGRVVATVFAAAALAVGSLPAVAANGAAVWTMSSLARVAPTGIAGSGTAVSLAAARGETES